MSNRPVGGCGLCHNTRALCDTHLLPTSAYKILKKLSPNGILLMDEDSYCIADKQLKAYLLCDECEHRFANRGEKWVMEYCYRGPSHFKFKEVLEKHGPSEQLDHVSVFWVRDMLELDLDKVIYFASSVFWRAGVRTWRRNRKPIHIDLGKYLEPLRLFLLDEASFPRHMLLQMWVTCWNVGAKESRLSAMCHPPYSGRSHGRRCHKFGMLGFSFRLIVGNNIPTEWYGAATTGPRGAVLINSELDFIDAQSISDRYATLTNQGR